MNLHPAPLAAAGLAAAAFLAPASTASAATVTLLEQERSASVEIRPSFGSTGPFTGFFRGDTAEDFSPFEFGFEDFSIPAGPFQSFALGVEQSSSFSNTASGSVLLQADLFVGAADSGSGESLGRSTTSFRIRFEIDEAAAFRFLGDGYNDNDGQSSDFLLEDSTGTVLFDNFDDPDFVTGPGSGSFSEVRETGRLEAGVYTLSAGGFAGTGGDPGSTPGAVELELFDSRLAGTAIPTPGALAAGHGLLAAGTLRRSRA